MRLKLLCLACLLALFYGSAYTQDAPRLSVVVEGLYHPVGMAALPDGGALIAEMGSMEVDTRFGFNLDSAGISLLRPDGGLRRLVSGFPSGRDPSDLLGVLPLALSPDGQSIIFGHHNAQQLYSLPVKLALDPPPQALTPSQLNGANGEAWQSGNVFLLHPFDIVFAADETRLISDSLANSIVSQNLDGRRSTLHRFGSIESANGKLEAVPRGLAWHDNELLATLFAGCPHQPNSGALVAIDGAGSQRTLVAGLNMPIDVAVDASGDIWLLEFAVAAQDNACFDADAYQPRSGILSRISANGVMETVVAGLDFPGAVLPLDDGGLLITEVYAGRVSRLTFGGEAPLTRSYKSLKLPPPEYRVIDDVDAALRQVIEYEALKAYPGREQLEGDTAMARLGRELFFDPILSGDQNISCATCHHPQFAMTDGIPLSIGAGGVGLGAARDFTATVQISGDTRFKFRGEISNPFIGEFIPRNSPTVINAALGRSQFWDSRIEREADGTVRSPDDAVTDMALTDTATAQALLPIVSRAEMAGATFGDEPPPVIRDILAARLRQIPAYVERFEAVFGTRDIEPLHIAEAIAAFERQLIFTAAPWDDYIAGDESALTAEQKRGALLFFGARNPAVSCAMCHKGDHFTDVSHYNLLAPQIGTGKRNGPSGRDDFGRANVSFDHRDQYKFRTPSLRNVELTAPYFHSGAYATLSDVVWHHADIWRGAMAYDAKKQLPAALHDSVLPHNFALQSHSATHVLAEGLPLSDADVADLVAFLTALTDPNARDLSHLIPASVPSGLPLDPLP